MLSLRSCQRKEMCGYHEVVAHCHRTLAIRDRLLVVQDVIRCLGLKYAGSIVHASRSSARQSCC